MRGLEDVIVVEERRGPDLGEVLVELVKSRESIKSVVLGSCKPLISSISDWVDKHVYRFRAITCQELASSDLKTSFDIEHLWHGDSLLERRLPLPFAS
jgi:hypothetical protein